MKIEGFGVDDLPAWLANLVALARPAAVTMTVAMAPMGAATVGIVAGFAPAAAMNMAAASAKFLQGIPEAAWVVIGGVAGVFTAARSAEIIKGPQRNVVAPSVQPGGTLPADVAPPAAVPDPAAVGGATVAGGAGATPTLDLE